MWYDPPTCVYGRQVVQGLLNDTSQLARNLQQTEEEKDRVLQVLELMEEKIKAEIAKRNRKVCWLRCMLVVSWLIFIGK